MSTPASTATTAKKNAAKKPLDIVMISGASGMVGKPLSELLTKQGHNVRRLVRRDARSSSEVSWSPSEGKLDPGALDGADAIIHLAGATVGKVPWTKAYRKIILDSRVQATETIVKALRAAKNPPGTLLSASAASIYGSRPGEEITEDTPPEKGFFLEDVVEAWEKPTHSAPTGTRVVNMRTGVVVGRGGAFDPLFKQASRGFAGPVGGGHQHWPWISLHDEVAAMVHLLTSELSGPVNLVGPTLATVAEIMRRIAKDMHKPYWFPTPKFILHLALREAANELILLDQKITPAKLIADGFEWKHRTVQEAIDATLLGSN